MMIGDLEAETGIPSSTIRYWERVGVLPKLAVLRLAQACGFHLDEMRQLLNGFQSSVPASRRWQELAKQKIPELDRQLARLKTMYLLVNRVSHCQCADLSQCGRIAASVMKPAAE